MARRRGTQAQDQRVRRLVLAEIVAGQVRLDRGAAHHLRDVLRLAVGARLSLTDRRGAHALAVVQALRPEVVLEVAEVSREPCTSPVLTVALSLPKGERADWAVEKLTELGVGHIAWLVCARSVATVAPDSPRYARWQRLADAAAAQAGVRVPPQLLGAQPVAEVVGWPADWRLWADRDGAVLTADRPPAGATRITLLVGPEGGFTAAERDAIHAAGYRQTRLAAATLRVETAALVGAALVQAASGGVPA